MIGHLYYTTRIFYLQEDHIMTPVRPPTRPAIDQFKFFTKLCLEQGITLPQLATILIEEMEKQTPVENRVYAGVCKAKWVEVTMIPWRTKDLVGNDEDIEFGRF